MLVVLIAGGWAMSATAQTQSNSTDDTPQNATPATVTLDSVRVSGSADPITEDSGSYAPVRTNAATGLTLTPRETPQAVTTVTRQQIEDQNLQTIDDVFGATAGVTFTQLDTGARTTYRARGFDISNYKIDGMAIQGGSAFSGAGNSLNLDLYDRVEIVRGANGLMGGTGDPSATVDLVRKRPGREFGGLVQLQTGSWHNKKAMADLNVPLTEDGRIRSRLVVSGENTDTFRDNENIRRVGVLASVEADLTDTTVLGLGFQYERSHTKGASWGTNVPIWFADGTPTDLSRRTNLAADWSFTQREGRTFFASLNQALGQDWAVRADYAYTKREDVNNFGVVKVNGSGNNAANWSLWNQDGTGATLNAIHSETDSDSHVFNLAATGPFQLFGRQHELTVGLNGYRDRDTSYTFDRSNCNIDGIAPSRGCQYRTELPIPDWRDWDSNYYGSFNTFRTDARTVSYTTNYGGYVASRFSISDALSVIAGVRRSQYKVYSYTYSAANARSGRNGEQSQDVWTPYAGLTYDFNDTYTAYASYTDVFKPQTQKDTSGNVLEPIRGNSYELGLKSAWLNGALSGTMALFQAEQQNVAQTDGANTTPDGAQAYVAKGSGVRSRGVELELAGALTNNWNIYLGYTYLHVKDDNTQERTDPKHVVRLNTTYRLPGQWRKLTVGGGVSMQSHTVAVPFPGRPNGNGGFAANEPLRVSGYTLVNLMARYEFSDQLSATLNVNNLFDKTYYRQYGFYDGLIYGEPRRITLGLQARF